MFNLKAETKIFDLRGVETKLCDLRAGNKIFYLGGMCLLLNELLILRTRDTHIY